MHSVRNVLEKFLRVVQKKDGFSLIELAMVLAIMGILAGMLTPVINKTHHSIKHKNSSQRMEKILQILGPYVMRTGKLPLPAQSFEEGTSEPNNNEWQSQQGFVPYKTLGLPREMAQDGWGNPFRYAISGTKLNHNIAAPNSIPHFCDCYFDKPLDVQDTLKKTPVMTTDEYNPIIVVLIAFNESTIPQSPEEKENIDSTMAFYAGPYSSNPEAMFRQDVLWLTRDHLISVYGHSVCTKKNSSSPENKDDVNPLEDFMNRD